MKKSSTIFKFALCGVAFALITHVATVASAKDPVKIIYDTDMGNDIDDVFALVMLNNLEKRGEVDLLAITITKDNKYAAPYCQFLDEFYNAPDVPIGAVKDSGVTPDDGKYLKQSLEAKDEKGKPMFPFFDLAKDKTQYYEATSLLRKTLAAQEDGSVVIAQVGFSTNLARLLDSPGDEFSPLNGRELAAKKVKYLVAMAGNFVEKHKEFNVICDVPSAQKVFAEWPTAIYCSGFEVGREITMNGIAMLNDYEYLSHHPVKEAYRYYHDGLKAEDRQCTWDLTTILFAARPDRGYFDFSEPGFIEIDKDGYSAFKPDVAGNARLFKVNKEQIIRVQEAFEWLCSERLLD